MPTVKGYQQNVELVPLRGGESSARYSTDSPVGSALSNIGMKMYRAEVERQDEVAFLEADRKLSEWEQRTLYDPNNGALTKRGKDAFGVPDEVNKGFSGYVDEIRQSLNTQRQRSAFEKAVNSRRKDMQGTLARHVFNEARRFEEAETENYIKNSAQAAILNAGDPERISIEAMRAESAVRDFARRNGMGDEYVKQKVAQVRSGIHQGIVERLIAQGNDKAAEDYFKENKAEIAGDDIAKVEAKLQSARTEGEGIRGAADIWTKHKPSNDIDAVNIDAMMEDARKKYGNDPKVHKSVTQHLKERADVHNAAQRERREANGSTVWKAIEQGATLGQVQRMPEYQRLPGQEQNSIKTWIIDRADALARRADTEPGDDALYYRLMTEASSAPLQDKFAQTNLMEHRPHLSRTQFNHLVEVQTALRKGDTKGADKLLASERVQNQIVGDALLGMGLDPTPDEKKANTSKGKASLEFRRSARDAIRAHEARTGKNATDDEVQAIVDGLVIKGVVKKGIIFDDTKRVYELKPGESITIKITDVPIAERTKIEAALRRAGRIPTSEAITALYTNKLLQMRGTITDDPAKRVPQ